MKTENVRMLIHEDEKLASEIVRDLSQFKPLLNKVKESFDKLEIGKFTNTEFKILVISGTARYEKMFIERIEKELDSVGLKSEILRKNALKDHQIYLDELKNNLDKLKRFSPEVYSMNSRPKLPLKFISFINGFCIQDSDFERIKEEYCRIYLETPEQIKGYEALKALAEKYNQFIDSLELLNYNQPIMSFNFLSNVFDHMGNKKVKPHAAGFLSIATFEERQEAYRKHRNEFTKNLKQTVTKNL